MKVDNDLELYNKATEAYYSGSPIMSDQEFDGLRKRLIESGAIDESEESVGSINEGNRHPKLKHVLRMGSLHSYHTHGKINDGDIEFAKRYSEAKGGCNSSFKYDGLAIKIGYRNGLLESIGTRGDGFIGSDITEKFRHKVPPRLDNFHESQLGSVSYVELRGEIVIKKSVFEQYYSADFANPRNFVSGATNRSVNDHFAMEHLDIKLYKVCSQDASGNIQFHTFRDDQLLSALLPIGWHPLIDTSAKWHSIYDLPQVFEEFNQKRDEFEYLVDGVVTCFGEQSDMHGKNWKHSIAWKFDSPKVVAKPIAVEWSMRSNMSFTPVLIIEPVELAGTTVRRINAASYANLNNLGAWPGSLITVEKSGDIIPHISSVLEPVKYETFEQIPYEYLPNQEMLVINGAHLFTIDETDKALVKFMKGVQKLHVDGLGPAKIWSLWCYGFRSIWDLMQVADLTKKSQGVFSLVLQSKLGASWDKNWEKIAPKMFDRLTCIDPQHLLQVCEIDGVGANIAWEVCQQKYKKDYVSPKLNHKAFQTVWNDVELWQNMELYNHMLRMVDFIKKDINSTAKQILVCLTGSPKPRWSTKSEFLSDMSDLLQAHNAELIETDVKKAEILITDSPDSNSSKTKTAKSLNKKILTYDQIFDTELPNW